MKRISEFLGELGSHEIYLYAGLREEFKEQTGEEMPGKPYRLGTMGNSGDHRFPPTVQPGTENVLAISGFEVVEACVDAWAKEAPSLPELRRLDGRGSRFRAAIKCLEEVGQ